MATKFPSNMFHSARLKLTLFYFGVLVVFSLTLTLSTRWLALNTYKNSEIAQRGAFHHLFLRDFQFDTGPPPSPDSGIDTIQTKQEALVSQRINNDLVLVNVVALLIGGIVSYWYAGRTLRPIEEAHEGQKRFASDASHELRTPLANLKVENEVFLRQKSFSDKEARDLIKSNLEEVQRLENLAANLLSLNQYDNVSFKLVSTPISPLVDSATSSVGKAAKHKKVEIKAEIKPANVLVQRDSLIQLLNIVLDNAIKHGPESNKIKITGEIEDDAYVISVVDHGPGIDEDDLPFIFDRLYRGDKARSNSGGFGLGLSLAQEIARANQASISAHNVAGSGALFKIELTLS